MWRAPAAALRPRPPPPRARSGRGAGGARGDSGLGGGRISRQHSATIPTNFRVTRGGAKPLGHSAEQPLLRVARAPAASRLQTVGAGPVHTSSDPGSRPTASAGSRGGGLGWRPAPPRPGIDCRGWESFPVSPPGLRLAPPRGPGLGAGRMEKELSISRWIRGSRLEVGAGRRGRGGPGPPPATRSSFRSERTLDSPGLRVWKEGGSGPQVPAFLGLTKQGLLRSGGCQEAPQVGLIPQQWWRLGGKDRTLVPPPASPLPNVGTSVPTLE